MPDKTTYKALANGTLVAHVPLTFARTPCGGRLFAQEDGRNRDRNKELATVQTVALGALWRRVAASDRFPTRFKMAEHLRIDSSYLTRVIRLGYLSPYIVEKIAAVRSFSRKCVVVRTSLDAIHIVTGCSVSPCTPQSGVKPRCARRIFEKARCFSRSNCPCRNESSAAGRAGSAWMRGTILSLTSEKKESYFSSVMPGSFFESMVS